MTAPQEFARGGVINPEVDRAKPGREMSGIEQALNYTSDRLDRLSMQLDQLTDQLRPVLAEHDERKGGPTDVAGIAAVSPVGERIVGLGHNADRLGDLVSELQRRLEL